MPQAESKATTVWNGTLFEGKGSVTAKSGALRDQQVTWAARTERQGDMQGATSPEELIAAAHSACFSMAFSNILAKNGTTADELRVEATTIFEQMNGGWKIARTILDVTGKVPGIDDAEFQRLAEEAKNGCPVSGAVKGNVDLSVEARLAN